ncbi:MAG: M1 family metallopeptidase, partial [Deferrisomatales bacterium]
MTPGPGPRPAAAGLLLAAALGAALAGPLPARAGAGPLRHDLSVLLDPPARRIEVTDRVGWPAGAPEGPVIFELHAGLEPRSPDPGVRLEPRGTASGAVDSQVFRAWLPPGATSLTLTYGGVLHHPLSAEEDYARGFRYTPGTVSEEGVYLAGSSRWVPRFGPEPVVFSLEVRVPPGWEAVSQGGRTAHEPGVEGTRLRWDCPDPQDEVYLVAGPWTGYRRPGGPVELLAFLRQPDPALANRYLETGGQYLEMYSRLLGPYPYAAFSLVENFWETGWGMPGFTLLGPQILRFPFILHSSFPHEILHNWWGNGVYVDYAAGNWCEGLTAYLADHLIQEGRGAGAEHRQAVLQKYADYASKSRDFALTQFRARHSAASEAVGYGKAMMLYHMVRRELGDAAFVEGLRRLYREQRFRTAGFDDVRRAFETASGRELGAEFGQWVEREGAPELRLAEVSARRRGDAWRLGFRLQQVQPGPAYRLRVPYAVTLAGQARAHQAEVVLEGRAAEVEVELPGRPQRVDLDPEFDLFRRLDP